MTRLPGQVEVEAPDWAEQITMAKTVADLSRIWREATAAGQWTEDLEALGMERRLVIQGG